MLKPDEVRVDLISTDPPTGQKVGPGRHLIRALHIHTRMSVSVWDRRGQHRARAYALDMLEMMVEDFK